MPHGNWQPTTFQRFEQALDTSMSTARVVTDAGHAYLKGLGNPQGPHPLACEWVAMHLAKWLGLRTPDFALLSIDATVDEIPLFDGGNVQSGPAFVTRALPGHTWGGDAEELRKLANPDTVSRLVLFDTWTRNCDRCPPETSTRKPNYDNVFLADPEESGASGPSLVALDHSHCFTCGRDLDLSVANIDVVKERKLYGLFSEFGPHVLQDHLEAGIVRLAQLERDFVAECVDTIPEEWDVPKAVRAALCELIVRRAAFVVEHGLSMVAERLWPNMLFDNRP